MLGGHAWRHIFMDCRKLEAMAIYVVKQAFGNEIMSSVYINKWFAKTQMTINTFKNSMLPQKRFYSIVTGMALCLFVWQWTASGVLPWPQGVLQFRNILWKLFWSFSIEFAKLQNNKNCKDINRCISNLLLKGSRVLKCNFSVFQNKLNQGVIKEEQHFLSRFIQRKHNMGCEPVTWNGLETTIKQSFETNMLIPYKVC